MMDDVDLSGRVIIRGTTVFHDPDTRHYKRETKNGKYLEDWQEITVRELVELYIEDEVDFTFSQYKVFFKEARAFLETVTYQTNEHRQLLRLAFVKYLNR